MTGRLEAPHRRKEQGPRIPQADGSRSRAGARLDGLRLGLRRARTRLAQRPLEKVAVAAYASAVWIVAHVPAGLARWVIGTASQAGYLLWPTKRAWSNANFGRVAGLPPHDRRVRRLALAAYRQYATYLVEVMRLESLSVDEAIARVVQPDLDRIEEAWKASPGGLIFALGHVGNNEAVAAGVANRGWPISVVADDSSFPEMFERFRRLREAWGIHVIPWRNLREIFGVLKRREMLALLVDWGYRSDGVPVRLFGAWTTLPAGPASLAAKSDSVILPVAIRRGDDGLFHVSFSPVITVASSGPADIQRATQQLADALGGTIGAAPEQWYSFKPIWPPTEEEAAELAHRADRMVAGDRTAAAPLATAPDALVVPGIAAAPDVVPVVEAEVEAAPPPLPGTEFGPT